MALETAGAIVEEVSLPHTDYGLATYYIVAPAEASSNLARYDGVRFGYSVRGGDDYLADYLATRGQGFGAEVKRRIMLGTYGLSAGYYDAFYVKAQKVRTLIKRDFDRLWEAGFDALVAPTSPSVAFPFGARMADPVQMYLSDACTLPVNMAGLPGISVPCGLSEGLPVGLQLIGAAWSEAALFRAARAYEGLTGSADWRRVEPRDLPRLDDPSAPTPAERIAASRGGRVGRIAGACWRRGVAVSVSHGSFSPAPHVSHARPGAQLMLRVTGTDQGAVRAMLCASGPSARALAERVTRVVGHGCRRWSAATLLARGAPSIALDGRRPEWRMSYPDPHDRRPDRPPAARRSRARPARARRPAVGHPAVLRHPRHDGRRDQPRGGGARLRHPARDRRGRRREPARGSHALHLELRHDRAAARAVGRTSSSAMASGTTPRRRS